ncbi:MAG: hypothetical protein CMB80_05500 [Flammeovirgaceae bacterium]|nr:hypothetical protein [Flammeovirgaceae bacterium]|tara:strand:+ start:6043 stop:6744 length:702 start_codon:yes stop_codon:yes gene_type:complete
MKFYEKMNDLDYPIVDVIKYINDSADSEFTFYQLPGCMHEQVFGQRGNEDRVPGVNWRDAHVFDRTVDLAINIDPGEGGDQGRALLLELTRLAFLMDEDDHIVAVMSGIRSYHNEFPEIWLPVAGYFWSWLQKKSIAYDTFTVARQIRPQDTRAFFLLICNAHHENSKEDDESRAVIAQCTNDFYFAGANLIGERGNDTITNTVRTLQEISAKLDTLGNFTSSLPNIDEFTNS